MGYLINGFSFWPSNLFFGKFYLFSSNFFVSPAIIRQFPPISAHCVQLNSTYQIDRLCISSELLLNPCYDRFSTRVVIKVCNDPWLIE